MHEFIREAMVVSLKFSHKIENIVKYLNLTEQDIFKEFLKKSYVRSKLFFAATHLKISLNKVVINFSSSWNPPWKVL